MNNLHEKIQGPAVAVDTVVFAIRDAKLSTLLIKIGSGPYKNKWATPGGLIQLNETPEQTALRVLKDKTNIQKGHLEQLYTFGEVKRDTRGQIISIAYLLLITNSEKYDIQTTNIYTDIKWVPVKALPPMAFDHQKIIKVAKERLATKMAYSTIASSLLPSFFTLTELQRVYEIIWEKEIDKRNFRKRMLDLNIITPVKRVKKGSFRPAQLYKFKKQELIYY
jgi:8-oxo-dGTP diphosphatase